MIKLISKDGKRQNQVSGMAWELMGKEKNREGWILDEGAKTSKAKKAVTKEIGNEKEYQALLAKAKGADKDGKQQKALDLFQQVLAIKSTGYVKGRVTALTNAITAAKQFEESFNLGLDMMEGDPAVAQEFFITAKTTTKDKALIEKADEQIKICDAAIAAKAESDDLAG